MSQQPRRINTSRARQEETAPARTTQGRRVSTSAAKHGGTSGGAQQGRGPEARAAQPAARRPRKKKRRIRWWMPVLAVLVLVGAAALYAVSYVNRIVSSITPDEDAASLSQEIQTAPEYQGDVVGVLVCGIDYEEGRSYSDSQSNDGMTDMIMYVQFDVKNKKLNMVQIPRNTLVGSTVTLENGKTYRASNGQINSIALSNSDGIAALAEVIHNNYKLPIDYYATIDMQALSEVVDRFGGIEVYIPHDISYGGSLLKQGYRMLDGASAEFFVRNRKGEGYANSDIDRLNMQRYFYAGLFKRARTMSVADVIKLMPVIMNDYVTTDCDVLTLISLGISFLKVDSASIMVCQTPVFMDCEYYNGNSIVVADRQAVADLLNAYFRDYSGEVPADQLNILDWQRRGAASTNANVQYMGQLDAEADAAIEAGTDVEGAQVTG